MDRLRPEVLQQICFACNTATAESLRCCSTRFDELAARAIFREIYVAKFHYSIDKMAAIAKHPNLRLETTADTVYWPEYHSYATKVMNSLKYLGADFYLLALDNYDLVSASIPFQITEFLNAARSVESVELDFHDRHSIGRVQDRRSLRMTGLTTGTTGPKPTCRKFWNEYGGLTLGRSQSASVV